MEGFGINWFGDVVVETIKQKKVNLHLLLQVEDSDVRTHSFWKPIS